VLKRPTFSPARPQRAETRRSAGKAVADESTGGVTSGAHGATDKEHHVCARRRVGEASGSPLRMLSRREGRMRKSASWRAGVGRVRNAAFFSILPSSVFVSDL
jgi:hypothetical protein